ncbi:MAG TPA: copper-binding protein [Candidatus Solibacter sp.]|nr:copper-binding protein [Candidatus Solibacter sp.]
MKTLLSLAVSFCIALLGCGGHKARRLPMHGVVKALDATTRTAVIDAGKIDDWMEAMAMEYAVKPDAEFQKLHVGDKIEATVVVEDVKYYVTDIKVVP